MTGFINDELSQAEIGRIREALLAAIGWVAAGTNEGNNATSQFTREQLLLANRHLGLISDRFDSGYQMGLEHAIKVVMRAKEDGNVSLDGIMARIGQRLPNGSDKEQVE